jgi:hypothetical protein
VSLGDVLSLFILEVAMSKIGNWFYRALGSCAVIALALGIAGAARAADAPKPGAESAAELVVKFADAVDNGDTAAIKSCLDMTKPGSRAYADYLCKFGEMNAVRVAVLKQIEEKYGEKVREQAREFIYPHNGAFGEVYASLKELPAKDLKAGGKFYPPGFKGEAEFIKKDGVFLLETSGVLDGVIVDYLEDKKKEFGTFAANVKKAADAATSADDLLARLKAL